MSVIAIPKALRDKLGDDATDSLIAILDKFEQSSQKGLATKEDIANLRSELKEEMALVKSDIKVMKWILGVVIAGILSLILKAFF